MADSEIEAGSEPEPEPRYGILDFCEDMARKIELNVHEQPDFAGLPPAVGEELRGFVLSIRNAIKRGDTPLATYLLARAAMLPTGRRLENGNLETIGVRFLKLPPFERNYHRDIEDFLMRTPEVRNRLPVSLPFHSN